MTLRKKTLLIIGVVLIGLIGALYTVSSTILLRSLEKLEEQDTRQNVKRFQDALSDDIVKLNATADDWSLWDDTYVFVEDGNKAYIKDNLYNDAMVKIDIDLVLYTDLSGRTVFSKDLDIKSRKTIPISENVQKRLAANGLLLPHPAKQSKIGIVLLPKGPVLVSSRPILTSEGKGPAHGTLLMGRYLDAAMTKQLAEKTHLSLTIHPVDAAQIPPDFRAVRSALSSPQVGLSQKGPQSVTQPILVRPLDKDYVAGYTLLKDINSKPALLVRVDIPRVIYQQGQVSLRYLILSLLVVGMVFGVATLLLLEQLVLSRLSRLSSSVSNIGTSGELTARVSLMTGKDELSSLAGTINEMLEALEHTQRGQQESEQRLQRQNWVLAGLAKKMLDRSDLNASLREITEAAARTLEVERASVWLYSGDRSKIHCINLYEQNTARHVPEGAASLTRTESVELAAASYPAYFKALAEERTITVHNVCTDLRTKEFSEVYLSPLGITSLLNAPVRLGGQMVGIVSYEHVGLTHQWVLEEQNFASSIADLVSLAMEAWEHKRSEKALQAAHNELELRVQERTAELATANQVLQHDAFHDSLTGLPNRALFMERLRQAIEVGKRRSHDLQAGRTPTPYLFAVLFLDLDRFKVVNDSLGHLIGDQLLVALVQRLEACTRPGDTIARLGGDEFTILLDNINEIGDATWIAERLQKELAVPFNLSGHEVFTTASIGIASGGVDGACGSGYDRPEELLRDADTAMYRAKILGKARHEIFDTDMHTHAVALLELETDLRRAIEHQEFQVYYQPIVELKTSKIIGFEALVRWQHPDHGLISPIKFIPIAEETGLIVPIGQWVLREACRQVRTWQVQFPQNPQRSNLPLSVSVNLSSKEFLQPNLTQKISQILQETDLDARSLKLEITESAIMENAETTAAMLLQLKMLGVQLYIDDFGTGYSSLSYLHRFSVDALKIDRSFVSRMGVDEESDPEGTSIIQTIVTLAHNLNMDIVAEGIETVEQLVQLRELRCEYGQGYFFSKPLDSKAMGALIAMSYGSLVEDIGEVHLHRIEQHDVVYPF